MWTTNQREEHQESGDVADHAAQGDLQRSQYLEGRHQVRGTSNGEHVGNGEQHVGNYFRIVRAPSETSCDGVVMLVMILELWLHNS